MTLTRYFTHKFTLVVLLVFWLVVTITTRSEGGVKNDKENQKLIKEEWIREMMEVVVEELETILVEKIKKAKEKDKKVVKRLRK